MPEGFIQLPTDGTGPKVRTRERTIGANAIEEQYMLVASERVRAGQYSLASFRTLGTAATPQNIFTIENPSGSAVLVAVKRLTIQIDSTVALITVAPSIKASRSAALPTGGTATSPMLHDTTHAAAVAICRSATASDGGTATAIAATAGNTGWSQLSMRLHTAVGQVLMDDQSVIPSLCENDPIVLRAGQAILVQGVLASAATTHFVVNCCWEEFTLP